jgi:TolB-like protein/Tfp pilus assembly protein PilF
MPLDSDSSLDVKFEIGHVLFIDIVGYSKLLMHEQSEQLQRLKEIVRATAQFRLAEAEGKLLRLPTGDGGALVFRNTTEAPVLCAIEISKALKNYPELQVRMGVHSGPVNDIADLNEQANIAGAGINIAQRVMDCGDAGHILLSRHVAEDLEDFARWRPYLHDLGECEVKHGRKISLVNFYSDEVGKAEVPQKCQLVPAKAAEPFPPARPYFAHPGIVIAAAALLIGAIAGILFFSGVLPIRRSFPVSSKSIAVLPFENLSRDPENGYFADGIQEEILTRLSKIADLKVISRTSTERYKSAPENLREIADQLGVSNVLEGSVQKAGDQVRVNVQLIRADNDSHLWADKFDRKLSNIFSVETEIASKIADTLQAQLSGSAKQAIAARPTENSEAHDLYLRGRYFMGKRGAENFRKAIDYFNQAIAKDPNYALAYAGLSDCYDLLPQWNAGSRSEYVPKAKAAAIKAVAIDNNLAEAHASLGAALYSNDMNFVESKREFERAIELDPNYANAHYFFGFSVLLALGEFDRAIAELRRAVELDPFSVVINANLGYGYTIVRRYPEALSQLQKTLEMDPNFGHTYRCLGQALELSGQLDQAIAAYEKGRNIGNDDRLVMMLAPACALKGDRERRCSCLIRRNNLKHRVVFGPMALPWFTSDWAIRTKPSIGWNKLTITKKLRGSGRSKSIRWLMPCAAIRASKNLPTKSFPLM